MNSSTLDPEYRGGRTPISSSFTNFVQFQSSFQSRNYARFFTMVFWVKMGGLSPKQRFPLLPGLVNTIISYWLPLLLVRYCLQVSNVQNHGSTLKAIRFMTYCWTNANTIHIPKQAQTIVGQKAYIHCRPP